MHQYFLSRATQLTLMKIRTLAQTFSLCLRRIMIRYVRGESGEFYVECGECCDNMENVVMNMENVVMNVLMNVLMNMDNLVNFMLNMGVLLSFLFRDPTLRLFTTLREAMVHSKLTPMA